MFRHWMRETVRGVTLVACVLVLALSAGEVAQSSGFGACMAALRDDVLSLLGVADGDPTRTRVNESGALWTVDSDLADTIDALGWYVTTESAKWFPPGTRTITFGLMPIGTAYGPKSATDFISVGGASGALHYKLHTNNEPLVLLDLDAGAFGTTVWVQSGFGSLSLRAIWTVSQNPD